MQPQRHAAAGAQTHAARRCSRSAARRSRGIPHTWEPELFRVSPTASPPQVGGGCTAVGVAGRACCICCVCCGSIMQIGRPAGPSAADPGCAGGHAFPSCSPCAARYVSRGLATARVRRAVAAASRGQGPCAHTGLSVYMRVCLCICKSVGVSGAV